MSASASASAPAAGSANAHEQVDVQRAAECVGATGVVAVYVSGKRFAGKDRVADVVARVLREDSASGMIDADVQVVSVSDMCKREYAAVADADPHLLIRDREYKEAHREHLTAFYLGVVERHGVETYVASLLLEMGALAQVRGRPLVVLVVGIRRRASIEFLHSALGAPRVVGIRLTTPDPVRCARGWVYEQAKDTHVTETELDGFAGFAIHFDNVEDGDDAIVAWSTDAVVPAVVQAVHHADAALGRV